MVQSSAIHNGRARRISGCRAAEAARYEVCEPRWLLTGISYDPNTSTVVIEGSSQADHVLVTTPSPTKLRVAFTGVQTVSFELSTVAAVLFRGYGGDDYFENRTSVASIVYGHAGNDTLIGGKGNDRIFGGSGNDLIRGGAGDDELRGGEGNDTIYGGLGNDAIYGDAGDDVLHGEAGNDLIRGGLGHDRLWGGPGDDLLYGDAGDDTLYGGPGKDKLYGHAGNDGLFGGVGAGDVLNGGPGADRLLAWNGDTISGLESIDARLNLKNETHQWTNAEVEVIDQAFEILHRRTRNTALLRDSLSDKPINIAKVNTLPDGGTASNYLKKTTTQSPSGTVVTYERTLRFAEWNESSQASNQALKFTTIHEIGHSWDSVAEIKNRFPNASNRWTQFLAISGWTQTNPNSSLYAKSLDDKWWYLKSAPFVFSYSRTNPSEDWGTVWEIMFNPAKTQQQANVAEKIAKINQLLDAMSST